MIGFSFRAAISWITCQPITAQYWDQQPMRTPDHLWREHAGDGGGSDEAGGLDVLDDLHEVGEGRVLVGEGLLGLADAALGPVPDQDIVE